jgi:alkanesulfonate monooxygenase SsuD/methylene tetrahydromethanopterin reductase-like flavin-dependent oxidoreductase (luciferase family)
MTDAKEPGRAAGSEARHPVELGVDTFGDVTFDDDGRPRSQAQVLRDLVEQGVLADQVGLDVIGVGEHHREDFAVSAPDVVLAAIAARTERIHLSSAVTVLSSDDPVRVHQRFATLDAVSSGRAEVILGRGSFVESFPLFGYDLDQYEELFSEKLDLFAQLLRQEPVTWQGRLRPDLTGQRVYPLVEHGPLRTWVGVGGRSCWRSSAAARRTSYRSSSSTTGPSTSSGGRSGRSPCTPPGTWPPRTRRPRSSSGRTTRS